MNQCGISTLLDYDKYWADGNLPWVLQVCFSFLIPDRQRAAKGLEKKNPFVSGALSNRAHSYFIYCRYFENGPLEPA